ncbi:MAG: agmatine deiminase family protein [Gammaproteobacteria bacterium]
MSQKLKLPAEWASQDAVLLAWPHAQSDWLPILPHIENVFTELVYHIARFEHVVLLCQTPSLAHSVREKLLSRHVKLQRVHFLVLPYNDTWLRDSGPISVIDDSNVCLYDFRFNGWGGKFDASLDDQICRVLSQNALFKGSFRESHLILEGGSIDSDGQGTLLTTRQCLLTDTRNPAMQTTDYENFFAEAFGTRQVIWLAHGELEGDDTDGHVDMLARFCDPQTIAYTSCEREDDDQYESLKAMADELASLRNCQGEAYKLVPLPIPEAIYNESGRRLPASYANFLIINGAVLVPCYQDRNDERILETLRACFPRREVIGIDARAVIEQNGSLHCLSMQLPKGSLQLNSDRA